MATRCNQSKIIQHHISRLFTGKVASVYWHALKIDNKLLVGTPGADPLPFFIIRKSYDLFGYYNTARWYFSYNFEVPYMLNLKV